MNKRLVIGVLVSVAVLLSTAPGILAHASSSEQVVFSGTGFGKFGGVNTPFGFWIWCESDSSNPYLGQCSGAMYFYALGIIRGVGDTKPIAEPSPGAYVMTVGSADNAVACVLSNATPLLQARPTRSTSVAIRPLAAGPPPT